MRRWLIVPVGLLAVALALVIVGLLLPRDHVARVGIVLRASPDQVWRLVADVTGTARWRSDVTRVDALPAVEGRLRFLEVSGQGEVPFELVSQEPVRRQVVRVVDDEQPFGGTWTWQLEPEGSGTRLTITEAGFVKNPVFRVMGALFFSPTATLTAYETDLAKALGEDAQPYVVQPGR